MGYELIKKYWKIIVAILFALALTAGFFQRQNLAEFSFGSRSTVTHFTTQSADTLEGYYNKAQDLIRGQNPKTEISFLAVGDIMLSRNVAAAIEKANNTNLPFEKMEDVLKSTDFNFGNLESPFASTSPIIGGHSLIFNSPGNYIKSLVEYNFKILNLANNHALDQGLAGLLNTKKMLIDNGIQNIGNGKDLTEAWKPAIMEAKGIKICFLGASYASANDNGKTTNNYVARIEDMENLKNVIAKAKTLCNFTVVAMHAGTEYARTPNDAQINFAHTAIDEGADMVIGSHPHWIQTIEQYAPNCPSPIHGEGTPSASEGRERLKCGDPKYIFYSLGNFIFDQNWSQDTKQGLTLSITISSNQAANPLAFKAANTNDLQGQRQPAKLESIELIPVIIENSQPRPTTPDETKKILEKIGQTGNILLP